MANKEVYILDSNKPINFRKEVVLSILGDSIDPDDYEEYDGFSIRELETIRDLKLTKPLKTQATDSEAGKKATED